MALTAVDAAELDACLADGGFAVFGADTVYGVACDPSAGDALERIYELKGRRPEKPSAVLFFDLDAAIASLDGIDAITLLAARALLPGAVTLLLPNPRGLYPLACGPDPDTLGLRVPVLADAASALEAMHRPILQTSANISGEPAPRRLADVPAALVENADLVLDAGELPGTASTVVDLRAVGTGGPWTIVREGAVSAERIAAVLDERGRQAAGPG